MQCCVTSNCTEHVNVVGLGTAAMRTKSIAASAGLIQQCVPMRTFQLHGLSMEANAIRDRESGLLHTGISHRARLCYNSAAT